MSDTISNKFQWRTLVSMVLALILCLELISAQKLKAMEPQIGAELIEGQETTAAQGFWVNMYISHKSGVESDFFLPGEDIDIHIEWKYDESFDINTPVYITVPQELTSSGASDSFTASSEALVPTWIDSGKLMLDFSAFRANGEITDQILENEEEQVQEIEENEYTVEPQEPTPEDSSEAETNIPVATEEEPVWASLDYIDSQDFNNIQTGYLTLTNYKLADYLAPGDYTLNFIVDVVENSQQISVPVVISQPELIMATPMPMLFAENSYVGVGSIGINLELAGGNKAAFFEPLSGSEAPIYYNGEKTSLKIMWEALESIPAGTSITIQLPLNGDVFFRGNTASQADILSMSLKVGTASINDAGLITMHFTKAVNKGVQSELTVDAHNIFTTLSEDTYDYALNFDVKNGFSSGVITTTLPCVLKASSGIGLGSKSQDSAAISLDKFAYSNWDKAVVTVNYYGSQFGISAGDCLQFKLPASTGEDIRLAQTPVSFNLRYTPETGSEMIIGKVTFTKSTVNLTADVIFTETVGYEAVSAFARVYGGFFFETQLAYGDSLINKFDAVNEPVPLDIPILVTGGEDLTLPIIANPYTRPAAGYTQFTPPDQRVIKRANYLNEATYEATRNNYVHVVPDDIDNGIRPIRYKVSVNRLDLVNKFQLAPNELDEFGRSKQKAYKTSGGNVVEVYRNVYDYNYGKINKVLKSATVTDELLPYTYTADKSEKYYQFIDPASLMVTRYLQTPHPDYWNNDNESMLDKNFTRPLNGEDSLYALTPFMAYHGYNTNRGLNFAEFYEQVVSEGRPAPSITWKDINGKICVGMDFTQAQPGFMKSKIIGFSLNLGDINDYYSRVNDYNMVQSIGGATYNYSVAGNELPNYAGYGNISPNGNVSVFDFSIKGRKEETHGKSFEYAVYYNAIPDNTVIPEMIDDLLNGKSPYFANNSRLNYYYEDESGSGTGGTVEFQDSDSTWIAMLKYNSGSWGNASTKGLTIQKLDENNQPMSGVQFYLDKLGTTGAASYRTDASGSIKIPSLSTGTYRLREVMPNDSYINFYPVVFEVTTAIVNSVRHSNGIDLTYFMRPSDRSDAAYSQQDGVNIISNIEKPDNYIEPKYGLTLIKENTEGEALPGIPFSLKKYDDKKRQFPDETFGINGILHISSSEQGVLAFTGLTPGYYTLSEDEFPIGYQPLDRSIEFSVEMGEAEDAVITGASLSITALIDNTIANEFEDMYYESKIQINKVDAANGLTNGELAGYQFELFYSDGFTPVRTKSGAPLVINNTGIYEIVLAGTSNTKEWDLILKEAKAPEPIEIGTVIYDYSNNLGMIYELKAVNENGVVTLTSKAGSITVSRDGFTLTIDNKESQAGLGGPQTNPGTTIETGTEGEQLTTITPSGTPTGTIIRTLDNGNEITQVGDEYILIDESGVPLNYINVPGEKTIQSMSEVEIEENLVPLSPVTVKGNPKTTDNSYASSYWMIPLCLLGLILINNDKLRFSKKGFSGRIKKF